MERGWLGDGYIQRTGFLPLAEANNIVMIFPQVSSGEVIEGASSPQDISSDQTQQPQPCQPQWMLGLVGLLWRL